MTHSTRHAAARLPLLATALALAFVSPFAMTAGGSVHAPSVIPPAVVDANQFIVRFKDGSAEHRDAAQRQRTLDGIGRAQGLRLGLLRRLAVGADVIRPHRQLSPGEAQALLARLRADPRVQYASIDARIHPQFVPDDARHGEQWALHDPVAGIAAPSAWDRTQGAGQVIAVLDTGITPHSELDGNVIAGWDFVANTATSGDGDGRDPDPSEPTSNCSQQWHGTAVAGVIGAVANNGAGIAGVAFGAKIQPIRVLGACQGQMSDLVDAIVWASGGTVDGMADNPTPASVINLSLGLQAACVNELLDAVTLAVANGATLVTSAGNNNEDAYLSSPANCNDVIAVAASNHLGERSSYSNYGAVIDLSAPGGDVGGHGVLTTYRSGTSEAVLTYVGSSLSAAHVSGAAALVRAVDPTLSPAQVKALLVGTTRPLAGACPGGCGTGILDIGAAVAVATEPYLTLNGPAAAIEGDAGSRTVAFTVSLDAARATDVAFDFSTANGTAVAGSDYVAVDAPAQVIAAGETTRTFQVTILGDADAEADESFTASITNATAGLLVTNAQATARIQNDDVTVLANAIPLPGQANLKGQVALYRLAVPENATDLVFDLSGGSGFDARMRVRPGALPTLADYACTTTAGLSPCAVQAQAGPWFVRLDAVADYAGVSVVGSYSVPVDISIGDASVLEGTAGKQVITFTVSLSQATAGDVTYDVATANGTAMTPGDYVGLALAGETIAGGQLARTFEVEVIGDESAEPDEQFTVDLGQVSGATVTDGQGIGTILSDDDRGLSIADASVVEGDGGTRQMQFTVALSSTSTQPVTFDIATTDGAAVAGSDYDAASATGLAIPAGEAGATFAVAILGDATPENDEAFAVDITNASGASIADAHAAGTITNDDLPTLSIGDASVAEGNAGTQVLTFLVSSTPVAPFAVAFDVATSAGTATAGSDYDARALVGETIPAGQSSRMFSVTVHGDTSDEGNETVLAGIANASGAAIGDGDAVGTIVNDDAPTLSLDAGPTVLEGDTGTKTMGFTVRLSKVAAYPVTYDIGTSQAQSTATAGSDYVASSLAGVTIPAGQLSKVFAVTINGDTTLEANEILRVVLSGGSVAIAGASVFGTIANDDGPKLSIADAGFQEGNSGTKVLNFTVTLSQASTSPVTFSLQTAPGAGTASAGADYIARAPTAVSIAAGSLTRQFSVTVNGDTAIEGNETFFVWITSASVPVTDGQARGLIVNDDGPVLSIGDAVISEGNSGTKLMTFTVSLSKAAVAPVTYNLATINLTATGGVDYQGSNPTGLTIPAGQLSKTFTVVVNGDTTVEANETLQVNLSLGNVSILDGVGVGTITNDD